MDLLRRGPKPANDVRVSILTGGIPMPKFAANLSLLFTELPYADRFAAARQCGFGAVEILSPYDQWVQTCAALEAQGLDLILTNMPQVGRGAAALGRAATPGAEQAFRQEMQHLLDLTAEARPEQIHVMSGDGRGQEAMETFVANLLWLLEVAPDQRFTIEPLNGRDRPDYFMNDYDLAADVLDAVGDDRLGLQYDTYHAHMIHGDAMAVWQAHQARVTHVQIGNPPNRQEPGPGPVDFAAFFAAVDGSGYDGWVSAEYTPSTRTQDTLGWMGLS